MGKNYDNWERLVKAVSRREEDKLLALTHSVSASSSSSSSQLSFSSTFQLGHLDHPLVIQDTSRLPMEYSDLSVDRKDWKAMLPPGTRQVVWRSLSMSFFLDGRTGKNCFLLGAVNLMLTSGCFDDCWEINIHPQSRFSEAAELIESQHIYIEGNIKTKLLSSETCYAAYLVFGFAEMYAKLNSEVSIVRNFYEESESWYVVIDRDISRNLSPSKTEVKYYSPCPSNAVAFEDGSSFKKLVECFIFNKGPTYIVWDVPNKYRYGTAFEGRTKKKIWNCI